MLRPDNNIVYTVDNKDNVKNDNALEMITNELKRNEYDNNVATDLRR
jgi:hypothetical protein